MRESCQYPERRDADAQFRIRFRTVRPGYPTLPHHRAIRGGDLDSVYQEGARSQNPQSIQIRYGTAYGRLPDDPSPDIHIGKSACPGAQQFRLRAELGGMNTDMRFASSAYCASARNRAGRTV